MSQYVSAAAGGAATAAQRMGSSRGSAARLAGFLADVGRTGPAEALRSLDLGALAGQPIESVFAGLADYVCPEGGSVDEGIARDAFIETIGDLAAAGIQDFNALNAAQMQTVFELYVAHAIEARICNDIGSKIVAMPSSTAAAEQVQNQLNDFIERAVADAVDASNTSVSSLTSGAIEAFVEDIYRSAFEILEVLGDEASK